MAFKPTIWTSEARKLLYQRLVARFGPSSSWETTGSPGNGLDDAFEEFCIAFAAVVGAKSGDAVKHQIIFAMPELGEGSEWTRHAQTAILNKAYAMEEGFIEDRDLPVLSATSRE
ncbi:MAG: hypothetical protein AAFS13_05055 [Pseudomonadota bacterium]